MRGKKEKPLHSELSVNASFLDESLVLNRDDLIVQHASQTALVALHRHALYKRPLTIVFEDSYDPYNHQDKKDIWLSRQSIGSVAVAVGLNRPSLPFRLVEAHQPSTITQIGLVGAGEIALRGIKSQQTVLVERIVTYIKDETDTIPELDSEYETLAINPKFDKQALIGIGLPSWSAGVISQLATEAERFGLLSFSA
ncbi:MAG: hypothetical protein NVS1B7_3850 [Candidatus Saccharimonadales bacterium]